MTRHLLFFLVLSSGFFRAISQELNCQISINVEQIQVSTKAQIADQLKKAITEFMNNTKWTNETYGQQEKIDASILIIIKDVIGPDEYSGSIQISSTRPVYKSAYSSQILNIEDETFQFKFQQYTPLEFNLQTFRDNLTSVLQYYAYVILATDNDSFAPLGGTAYWQKAQVVVNTAQNAAEPGWRSTITGGLQKNRYWLVENSLQPVYKGVRECVYEYSRNGLDHMYENVEESRTAILKALDLLKPVYAARPASYIMQQFFNAKRDELINIFRGATPEEKTKAVESLTGVDPAGTTKYQKIGER